MTASTDRCMSALPGQHIISLPVVLDTQLDLVAASFNAAIERGWQCLYIADERPRNDVIRGLSQRGFDAPAHLQSGALQLLTLDETYLAGGRFDPERMVARWISTLSTARASGFGGLCATGEATWIVRGAPGVDRWLEYEARLDATDLGSQATLICQYDPARLPGPAKTTLMACHPFVQNGVGVAPNVHYTGKAELAEIPLLEELEPASTALPCRWLGELISAAIDDELLRRRCDEVAQHLAVCQACAQTAEDFRSLKAAVRSLREPVTPPGGWWDQVRARLDA